ncbi:MAG: hypothetical protein MR826_00575, partial [Veillonellaceae bacterium]|nr:hypothetical protein [Veillonellaceae bacterium]
MEEKKEKKEKSVWNNYTAEEKQELFQLNESYKAFLSQCKTERESTEEIVRQAELKGYRNLQDIIKNGESLKAGDKVYATCMKKAVAMFNIGSRNLEEGMSILGAHIDTCRLDLKQKPLYEADGMAYFDTHYYGGIKKYQWVTLPLALHGVVVKKDGTVVKIVVGENEDDPVFCVTDLLIHLSQKQMEKKATVVVEGEDLDILIGSHPLEGEEKDAVKAAILKLLEAEYGIEEDDFLSAELTMVPAGKARDLGLDRSMVLAYGHDDRVCAYTSLAAMLEVDKVERTSCCLLVDKEEIGSVGASGMQSRFFENMVAELLHALGGYNPLSSRRCLANSCMLSSDVSSAFDSRRCLEELGGNKNVLIRSVRRFLQNNEHTCEQLRIHIANGNYAVSRRILHDVAGLSGNLRCMPLYEASQSLLNDLRNERHDSDEDFYCAFEDTADEM